MGVIKQAPQAYYATGGDHGDYRYIPLNEIIDSFNATYVGENKLCENVTNNDITFHALRALQELSYDTIRSTTAENTDLAFTESSDTNANFQTITPSDVASLDYDEVDDLYGNLTGARFGLDPQHSQVNGSFFIDETAGKFHFSSNLSGKTLVLKYLSDGVSSTSNGGIDLTTSYVPKLAEEAIYKHILYGVLLARKDTPAGTLAYLKKERFAETRKAKLRLSNIKLEELTQVLRGSSKIIKH